MNKIIVHRTSIEIVDYTMGDCYGIEKSFSVWDSRCHRYNIIGLYYDEAKRSLFLPRGTDIFRLETAFGCNAVVDTSHDPVRHMSSLLGLKYNPRDGDQIEAIKFMLGKPPYEKNTSKAMLALNLNTGKGKSYCAIATISYLSMTSAIITDTIGCLDQWIGYFLEYTDITFDQIYRISGSASIAKLYKMKDISQFKVYLIPHATLQNYGNTNGWDKVHELFVYLGIGLKIYDEAHLDFVNMCMIDYNTNTYLTYYLTATLGRSDYFQNKIFQTYFKDTPKINLFHEDTDPHTAYVGIKYNSQPSPLELSRCMTSYGLSTTKYANYVTSKPMFENMLHIILNKALSKTGKSLWYIGTNKAIEDIREWIYVNYPGLINNVGVYTSLTPKEIKHLELEKKIILTTTKSAGAAMDIKDLVEVVNLAEPFKSRVLAQQTFGRTRGDNTIYKDVVDLGFPQSRAYYNNKKPVFSKYATSCKEVSLPPNDLQRRADEIREAREKLISPIIFYNKDNE